MVLHLAESFINAKFNEINSVLDTEVKVNLVRGEFEFDNTPLSDTEINYQIFVTSVNSVDDIEYPNADDMNVRIDFIFLIAGKDATVYKEKFDMYVWQLRRLLKNAVLPRTVFQDTDVSFGLWINRIVSVNITNADRFENEYYRPSVEMVLRVHDESAVLSALALYTPNTMTS